MGSGAGQGGGPACGSGCGAGCGWGCGRAARAIRPITVFHSSGAVPMPTEELPEIDSRSATVHPSGKGQFHTERSPTSSRDASSSRPGRKNSTCLGRGVGLGLGLGSRLGLGLGLRLGFGLGLGLRFRLGLGLGLGIGLG